MSGPARVRVSLGERSYEVLIGNGLLDDSGPLLAAYARDGRIAVVSDWVVWGAQGKRLVGSLKASGIEVDPVIVPPGEETKSWEYLAAVVDELLALGIERRDHVVAFGGGMIGDLTGFAAAVVKRGCGWIQVPTTLLAQVDSSVGGKTGIDTARGKNLAGAFHQPDAVLIDPSALDTLPVRQVRAGYAETVKYGLIGDAALFDWCAAHFAALIDGDARIRERAIRSSVAAKAAIVAEDERELNGRRALLNLGHTFGHAIEAEHEFGGTVLHGEAVAVGMALAFRFSAERRLCPQGDADRVTAHLRQAGLPVTLAEAQVSASGEEFLAHMAHDKKTQGGRLPFVLARGIGQAFVDWSVEPAEVVGFLERERTRDAG